MWISLWKKWKTYFPDTRFVSLSKVSNLNDLMFPSLDKPPRRVIMVIEKDAIARRLTPLLFVLAIFHANRLGAQAKRSARFYGEYDSQSNFLSFKVHPAVL
jgi:hypothetical protein